MTPCQGPRKIARPRAFTPLGSSNSREAFPMQRGFVAALGVVALLAVPATAGADEVIVKYKSGVAAKSKTAVAERAGLSRVLGAVEATGAEVVQVADANAAAA